MDLENHTRDLKKLIAAKKPMEYQSGMSCDVWFEPKIVWEVKCADLTISPVHLAAVGMVPSLHTTIILFVIFILKVLFCLCLLGS